ncbi:bifunctional riboflavin kinase/FAD synthetase [Peredibacter sp. HCB2-198]|uniref:bifunctional riboflavin kinase/FAD synthetase n=1 Tax=Peredibacter sp. HCB2-198 TaxID=3383025 RepID=UPI0038B67D68
MEILHNLLEIPKINGEYPAIGLTIGNFDGVHIGHRQLLKKIKNDCLAKNLLFVVVTFVPHPQKILQPDKERFLINSYEQRRTLLKNLGVDVLVELKFTRDFSTLKAEEFLSQYLLSYPNLKEFYLGYDFAFGANKEGDYDLVKSICHPRGVQVEIQPKYEFQGQVVSSSLIRERLLSGKIDEVKDILERPFHLEGVVVKGEGRGKKIGFPTANIQVSQDLIVPQKGVYVTRTIYNGMTFKSITNIGNNPTFKDTNHIHIETNLFDFDIDIYGELLDIQFLHKVRDEKKFPTVNDLIGQIKADVEFAKEYLREK